MWIPKHGTKAMQMASAPPQQERQLKSAIQAEDLPAIIHVLHDAGNQLFNLGRVAILQRALNRLPDTIYLQDTDICLLGARLAQAQNNYTRVEVLHRLVTRSPHLLTPRQSGEFQALLAQIAISQNHPNQAKTLAETALMSLDHASDQSRLIAISVLGEIQYTAGHLSPALALMQQTERLAALHQLPHQLIRALIQQIEIHLQLGNPLKANAIQLKAQELAVSYQLYELPVFERLIYLGMECLFEAGHIEQAESLARHYMSQPLNNPPHPLIDASLALLALSQQQLNKARTYLERHKLNSITRIPSMQTDRDILLDKVRILYWTEICDEYALKRWLSTMTQPTQACNHLSQTQCRSIARAHLYLGHHQQAMDIVHFLTEEAQHNHLTFEVYKNQCLEATCYAKAKQTTPALDALSRACQSAFKLGMRGQFYFCSKHLLSLLPRLLNTPDLHPHVKAFIQDTITQLRKNRNMSGTLPQLKRINATEQQALLGSKLTPREWQVLTAIYSGAKNEAIAIQLNVTPTTLKTHIRNVYKKLNVTKRKQAINFLDNALRNSKYLHL